MPDVIVSLAGLLIVLAAFAFGDVSGRRFMMDKTPSLQDRRVAQKARRWGATQQALLDALEDQKHDAGHWADERRARLDLLEELGHARAVRQSQKGSPR